MRTENIDGAIENTSGGHARRFLARGAGGLLIVILLFAVVEGCSSIALIAYDATKTINESRKLHTRYSSELGWEPVPNKYLPDIYGKGVYVRTNLAGFRNNREFGISPPAGKLRIICSGDSFTFGVSVDNDHAWCQELANRDSRLETINMGQIGYGIDQAYLLYLRDGVKLEHDVHIFAFIGRDLERMNMTTFLRTGKPILELQGSKLVVKNTPVPRNGLFPGFSEFDRLKILQLLRAGMERIFATPRQDEAIRLTSTRAVAAKVFAELKAENQHHHRLLVFVYLPWAEDYRPDPVLDERREFLRREIENLNVPYFDLTEGFRKFSPHEAEDIFVREKLAWPDVGYWGHYNIKGNNFAASEVSKRLMAIPDFRQMLERVAEGHHTTALR